jgi:hypothetical protein
VGQRFRPKLRPSLVLEFSDGSFMSIEAAANNLSDLLRRDEPLNPEDANIRFYVNYVPPMLPFAAKDEEAGNVIEVIE